MNSICVLIATKNRKDLLDRALRSLKNQKILPEEVVIINDGSTDGTDSFLENYNFENLNAKYINRQVSGGVNVARHEGIRISTAKWIATLDDDDEFFPDAISTIKEKLVDVPLDYAIVFFNSKIEKGVEVVDAGFQFQGEKFHDLSYEQMMTKFRIKGDCKPVFNRYIFENGYSFPKSINGLESHMFYLLARDSRGIRCYPQFTTLIHQENSHQNRLSLVSSKQNPWPLLRIHLIQIPQHFKFYVSHPLFFYKKLKEMSKLFIRSIFSVFGFRW